MDDRVLAVSQLNDYVAGLMAHDPVLRDVHIRGEISNFKLAPSGHMYFILKDESALIRCVMFKGQAQTMDFLPADGMRVDIRGYVSLYTRDGLYQLYAQQLRRSGIGTLNELFEKLKAQLRAQGYFSPERKRALPQWPRKIGVVTSQAGAVIHDIKEVAWRRVPVPITLYPVKVQGDGAAQEIADAIRELERIDGVDVIIVARGGGSVEDLWAFNEKVVADAIFNSSTPIVSAVGHETDFTIADFVADVRAPTPSAAAEMVTESMLWLIGRAKSEYTALLRAMNTRIQKEKERLSWHNKSFLNASPARTLRSDRQKLDLLYEKAYNIIANRIDYDKEMLHQLSKRLESVCPLAVMNRGYALVYSGDRIVKRINELKIGEEVKLTFTDGTAYAVIDRLSAEAKELEERYGEKRI